MNLLTYPKLSKDLSTCNISRNTNPTQKKITIYLKMAQKRDNMLKSHRAIPSRALLHPRPMQLTRRPNLDLAFAGSDQE